MKRENWNKLYRVWSESQLNQTAEPAKIPEEKESIISRIKEKFKKEKPLSEEEEMIQTKPLFPQTETDLKHYFLNHLLDFQMKWATATITHTSFVDRKFYSDPLLKYILQSFPDTYLVMYHPIFILKKAPIEADILLISPIDIEVIQFIDYDEEAVITAVDERTWHIDTADETKKILNPIISLRRTEKLLKSILAFHELDYDIKKTVVSRNHTILFANESYNTRVIGKASYEGWFQEKRRLASPLKSQQIKVAETLLKHCQTTAVKRPEWEEDQEPQTIIDFD